MDIDAALGTAVKMEITPPGESVSPQTSVPGQASRNDMYDKFQAWASQNYGDSGKTKTVTRKKYLRIVRILTGKEHATSENSKFRFWVKAKGFRMGPPPPDDQQGEDQVLYVPTRVQTGANGEAEEKQYKRVAVVEDFFDIIYNVHVEMDGRGGKHAGQKRTYRAIAETYSFLPREAVTRFLMSCADCQKRMHLSLEHNNNDLQQPLGEDAPIIDFSLPITTTYLNHLRAKNSFTEDGLFSNDREESMSSGESEVSRERSPSPSEGHTPSPQQQQQQLTTTIKAETETSSLAGESRELEATSLVITNVMTAKTESECPVNMTERNGTTSGGEDTAFTRAVTTVKQEDRGHPERKRRASNESNSTKASENGLGDDVKEDEEEEENDEDEKMSNGTEYDPERLKAFNMFVRLFVDENLDRMVPISKQPKDKIQAILDACDRQFPEFHERSRKRIRTYLKSCRRMRRSKDGWESMRPTPPHLTSAAAEALLAQACENESNNAKRMRMGLEPLPVMSKLDSLQASSVQASQSQQTSPQSQPSPSSQRNSPQTSSSSTSSSGTMSSSSSSSSAAERPTPASSEYLHQSSPSGFRPPHELPSPFFSNSNGIFRPGFPNYQPPAHHHPPVVHAAAAAAAANSMHNGNGPTDLSMKKSGSSKNQLNPTEVGTIKQLIAGYRESAAFLYRSADELEQLLLQQN